MFILVVLFFRWFSAKPPRAAHGNLKQIEGSSRVSYYLSGKQEDKPARGQIVLLPSLGRAASDFNELIQDLNQAGYRTLAVEPRGMLDKTGTKQNDVTLFDLAQDVEKIVEKEIKNEKVIIIGHAFGNRVARAYANKYKDKVSHTILLAAGGQVRMARRIRQALIHCFWFFMPNFWRKREIRLAFFADENKLPSYWVGGWNIQTSQVQAKAVANTPIAQWREGGIAPMLVIQGAQDKIAPPEHTGTLLKQEFGDRIHVITLNLAGHALLPEQPQAITQAVLDFIQ